ncbi:hypothetical protein [Aequorivita sp. Q41]|uniref:hypothetical protein n=1 Tax=Aequorivita sp. Q41 TaxID=3153300 RepID=UPI003241C68C
MKKATLSIVLLVFITTLVSCGGGSGNQEATAKGFSEIEKEIKSEFGEDAYFTDVNIVYNESIGNIVGVTVTKDPESLKMGQWNQTQGKWTQNSEITLEVPEGTKAADYMYQLGDEISLSKLGELVEKSKKQLEGEKNLDNPTLAIASIIFPKNGDITKTEYLVDLKPETGGTSFQFSYKLNGELIKMDY